MKPLAKPTRPRREPRAVGSSSSEQARPTSARPKSTRNPSASPHKARHDERSTADDVVEGSQAPQTATNRGRSRHNRIHSERSQQHPEIGQAPRTREDRTSSRHSRSHSNDGGKRRKASRSPEKTRQSKQPSTSDDLEISRAHPETVGSSSRNVHFNLPPSNYHTKHPRLQRRTHEARRLRLDM